MPRGIFVVVDTSMYICMCCIKQLTIKTKFFTHADIVVLVSKFVVVSILSEWWSVPTTADHCRHIPVTVKLYGT